MNLRLVLLGWALQATVAIMAVAQARRRPAHRPIALLVLVTLLADMARLPIRSALLSVPTPYTGAMRALWHIEQALFLTWPFGVAAVCASVFTRTRLRWVFLAAALTIALLAGGYPTIRGATLATAYAVIHGAAVVYSLGCAAVWTRKRLKPRPEQAAALMLGGMDIALFAGPFAPPAPAPFDDWSSAQVVYAMLFGALILLHGGALWGGFMSSSPQRDSSRALH